MILSLGAPHAHMHLGWLAALIGLAFIMWGSVRVMNRLPEPRQHVVASVAQIAPMATAVHQSDLLCYGGVHFLGTGTYTAETPQEAEKLYDGIVAATGGKKRKRRFDPVQGMI